ncbi:MAG TPA: aldehyde dehydrogenase [Solirubrobacterales bacterium]|jgi:aldehyde dehydrogenase (NAD+)
MNAVTTSDLKHYGLYIGGRSVASAGGREYESVDPVLGEPWAMLADAGTEDAAAAVAAAADAFRGPWAELSQTRRGRLMMRFGDLIAEHAEEIAAVECRENGKLLKEVASHAKLATDWLYYFGGLADKIEGSVIPLDRTSAFNYTLREPLGVVAVIIPWNSPVLVAVQAMAPALAAGNTIVLKPSEVASAGVLEAVALAEQAGFPAGVINVVTGGAEAGEALISDPRVAKISFTGGTDVGRAIAAKAGERLARVTLELGGKSPQLVFADADLEAAASGVVSGIFSAGGQSCVAGSRVLVQAEVYDRLAEMIVAKTEAIRIGDPTDPETQMGPIASAPQLARVERMVDEAREDGAVVLAGGKRAEVGSSAGFFYEPTVLGEVTRSDRIVQNEVFGPVAAMMPFATEEEAIELANDTEFGLACGIWTNDVRRAHRVARAVEAGIVWINTYRAVAFNSPFGGYKASGIGRVNGVHAVDEYLQTKSVWTELSEEVEDAFVMKS